jgi:hypothetical protein
MNPVHYEQIMSLLGLIALWAFWYYLWKPQRVDVFRQKLFVLRSSLFDLAANGVVPFDHPAYTQLRLLINGLIRFAHRANLPNLIIASMQSEKLSSDSMDAWKKSVQSLPEESRKQLLAVHKEASEVFVKHVINGSISLCVYIGLKVASSIAKTVFLLVIGRKTLSSFTVVHARMKMDSEGRQVKVTREGAQVIEARVLYEEQRRTGIKPRQVYAQ